MEVDYQKLELDYRRSTDQDTASPARHPVIVVGAGPVGLSLALDLARQHIPVLVLDDDHRLSAGSRAICFAKRTLDIWDRLGIGDPMVAKGVSWSVGKVYFQDELVYSFDMLPERGHHRPAFVNLQQYYSEGYLYEAASRTPGLELRWRNKVVGLTQQADHAELTVETPDGPYVVRARYVVACDGSRSPLRRMLGQEAKGRTFRDRFLIADVKMQADFPAERWFWFDPPFHRNQSVLLHQQPDNVWRIDFQLGWDADPEEEKKPEKVIPRVKALLGKDARFEFEWISVYTFACQRMQTFRHRHVLFAGDSAHGVSPFGARGANSGVQDAENLAWKLRFVLQGHAPDRLLDTYASEREYAADENIMNSTRATDFITPKSEISRTFRDAVLKLSKDHPFARRLVNSGRLSVPAILHASELNTADLDPFAGLMTPGAPAADAPILHNNEAGWLLAHLGDEFTLVIGVDGATSGEDSGQIAATVHALRALHNAACPLRVIVITSAPAPAQAFADVTILQDREGLFAQRYDMRPGSAYLFRPDQHVAARWRSVDPARVRSALARATCTA